MAAPAPAFPHLLIVEADPALRLLCQQALAEMGYVITPAPSLEQAQRLLNQRPFDLIVTDTFSRSSQEALAPLRPLLALSHPLPVVLCTAWPFTEAAVKHEGFAALVQQPFELDHLVTTVAACLNQPWSPAQLRQAEVVQRYVACSLQGDREAALAFLTEEVQLYPWLVPAYPFARSVRGRVAALDYLQEQQHYFGALQTELVRLYPCPHGITMRVFMRWQDPSGAPQQQMVAVCVKVTPDGQVSQMGLPPPDERLLAQLRSLFGPSSGR